MKHTSGPWETGLFGELTEDDGFQFTRIYGPGENVIVCDVFPQGFRESEQTNANLIAAAPELLKSCEFLAAWDQSNDNVELISIACSLARQAIEKAEGR